MTTTHLAICSICEACCGIVVERDGQDILSIRGDKLDPMSEGHVCPKVLAMRDLHEDPDRVRRPMRRAGTKWIEIGWEEAIDEAAAGIARTQRRHGRDAVGLLYGNPTVHSLGALLFLLPLGKALRTRSVFSANSLDTLPRLLVSYLLYGNQALLPVPDLDRTEYLLMLGANPAVSNGSLMTAPGVVRRLRAIRQRGGRVVVFDPRRTETAALADEHHFIRPGADPWLLAAMARTVLYESAVVDERVALMWTGFEALRAALEPFTPEAVAGATGVDAGVIRRIAREFEQARSAVCYSRLGTCVAPFGTLATWLCDVLNVMTGNMDSEGGAMFAKSPTDLAAWAPKVGQAGTFGRYKSSVRGLPEFNGELPIAALAEESEPEGPRSIRALVTHAANPVLSAPNGRRMDRALSSLDFMVAIDLYVNETTRHAHLILPPVSPLERDQHPLLFHSLSVRNSARFAPAVFPLPPNAMPDWQIMVELAAALGTARGPVSGAVAALQRSLSLRLGPRGMLGALLRLGPYRLSIEKLLRHPHGMDLGPLEPRLHTLMGRAKSWNIAPELLLGELHRARLALAPGTAPNRSLVLIGRRELRSNNSWLHNSARLVRGPRRCTLLMNPQDARARGITAGQQVRISSRVGSVCTTVTLTDEMMPGVVSLPHGWGHGRDGVRLRVASAHAGVSMNDLTDDAVTESLSGTSVLNGTPVEVVGE